MVYYSFPYSHNITWPPNFTVKYGPTPVETWNPGIIQQDFFEQQQAIHTLPREYWPGPCERIGSFGATETYFKFALWKMACETDHSLEEIVPQKTLLYVQKSGADPVFQNIGGLTMADHYGHFNFRDVGKLETRIFDIKKNAEDFMKSPEGRRFALDNSDLLKDAPEIDEICVKVNYPGRASMLQLSEDRARLTGNYNIKKYEEDVANALGIGVDYQMRSTFAEEFHHLIRRDVIKSTSHGIRIEARVRELLIDMYGKMEEATKDAGGKKAYGRIKAHLEWELKNIRKLYEKAYSEEDGELESTLDAKKQYNKGETPQGL